MTGERPTIGVVLEPGGAATVRDLWLAARDFADLAIFVPRGTGRDQDSLFATCQAFFPHCFRLDEPDGPAGSLTLDGVVTFNDRLIEEARRLAARAGVSFGIPAGTEDKLVQRQRLREQAVGSVTAVAVNCRDDLVRAVETVGTPGVLKPRRGDSGAGITFLDDAEALGHEDLARSELNGLLYERRIGTDPDLPAGSWWGDFLSVEMMSTGSGHRLIEVFGKLPSAVVTGPDGRPRRVTTGDICPPPVDQPRIEAAIGLVRRALEALEVRWSVTHTEVLLSADGPEIIEVNCRVGGHLNRLTSRWRGVDMIGVALRLAVGVEPDLPPPPQTDSVLGGVFVPFPDFRGAVRSTVSVRQINNVVGVVSVDGFARHGQARTDNAGIMANAVLEGASRGEFEEHLSGYLAVLRRVYQADADPHAWLDRMESSLARVRMR
jgi:hypothetical protein